ncbi:MAG: hypothetical protein QNJ12_18955 [Ilumatobacter sp.]|uniref:hypothetical protein n=1 Tax=Ilumatobacter sp. TaxID=1967498 RepID=UPI00260A941C|nr:hypothetical protein [Ilumatobacter sp.]MDJ0770881.1 hypothetical protein [Ilumatobacter sp.]
MIVALDAVRRVCLPALGARGGAPDAHGAVVVALDVARRVLLRGDRFRRAPRRYRDAS